MEVGGTSIWANTPLGIECEFSKEKVICSQVWRWLKWAVSRDVVDIGFVAMRMLRIGALVFDDLIDYIVELPTCRCSGSSTDLRNRRYS